MRSLRGKVAVVTGAGRGIGRAIALGVAGAGARAALLARTEREIRSVERQIRRKRGKALAIRTDVTRSIEVEAAFKEVVRRFGGIDVLVNNAGLFETGPIVKFDEADWDRVIDANLKSIFLCTKAAIAVMRRRGGGHIVNILSIASREAFAETGAYCAAKWGGLGLSRVLAEELRPKIRVTAVLPGAVDTAAWGPDERPPKSKMIEPEDVAETVLHALSRPPRASLEEITVMPSSGLL